MRKRIVIIALLAFIVGSHSADAQTDTATQTAPSPKPQQKPGPSPQTPPKPVPVQTAAPVQEPDDATRVFRQSLLLLQEQERLLRQQRMFLRQPRPTLPLWVVSLLLITATLSLLAVALQPLLFRRSATALHNLQAKVDSGVHFLLENLQIAHTDISRKLEIARIDATERLAPISVELSQVKEGLARLTQTVGETPGASPSTAADSVRLEHQVLAEHWKQFRDRKDFGTASDSTASENPWNLVTELTTLVPTELQPSLEAVLTPYREHRRLMQKIDIIPRVVSGEMPLSSEAAELKRARDLAQLLIAAQSSDSHDRFRFDLQSWVTDTFLPFADLYLQSCQKAQLDQRDAELQKGMSLVRQILRIAAVEPMDLTLGETRFDSARHIGRLTSNDPRFPDGVITGVVRNGFVEGGHQVIRQPEVVVNRVR